MTGLARRQRNPVSGSPLLTWVVTGPALEHPLMWELTVTNRAKEKVTQKWYKGSHGAFLVPTPRQSF